MERKYEILIEYYNSSCIRAIARQAGIKRMRLIGSGYLPGHEDQPDYRITFLALPHQGYEMLVADTNGDPIWEDEDPQYFAELAESVGVTL